MEGAADGPGRAAADQQAHVVAAQAEAAAEARRDGGADLGVAALQPDRGADAVRHHGLQHDQDAVVQRHAPAVQRVGLDRVDRAARPLAGDQVADQPEGQAAEGGDRHGAQGGQLDHGAEALGGADQEQGLVDELGDHGHEPDHDAGAGADHGGEDDEPDLVGAHQGPQQVRRVHHHVAERAAMAGRGGAGGGGVVGRGAVGRRSGDGWGVCRAHDAWVALNARHAKRPARAGGAQQMVINTRRRRSPREASPYSWNGCGARSTVLCAAMGSSAIK